MSLHPTLTPLSQSRSHSPLCTSPLLGDDSTHRAVLDPLTEISPLTSSQRITVSGANQVEEIELSCLIIGDGLDDVFPVQIEKDNTIGNLRVKIKDENKHLLQSSDAKSLVLWKMRLVTDWSEFV